MSEPSVTVMPTASGNWNVYAFDGAVSHFKGAYATKEAAEDRAAAVRGES